MLLRFVCLQYYSANIMSIINVIFLDVKLLPRTLFSNLKIALFCGRRFVCLTVYCTTGTAGMCIAPINLLAPEYFFYFSTPCI